MTEPVFKDMLSPIAATEEALADDLRADLQARGSTIANLSPFSPFFQLLAAVFSQPVLFLRGLVVETILPGLFVRTAAEDLLDTLAHGLDETRKAAEKVVGSLAFYRDGTTGALPVPLGTEVESPEIDGVVYKLITTVTGTILDGNTSALVAARAENAGVAHNLGDGYYSVLAAAVPGIVAVANEAGWITTPGRDSETDDELRERLRLKWRRQSGWHTADTYRSLISDIAGIDPTDVYFDLSAPRGPGSADALILTSSGIPDAALVRAADDHINVDGNHGLGDDLLVKAMPALAVPIDVSITADVDATPADKDQLKTDVEDLLRAAFRESAAYAAVPRVAPFQRVSRSALGGEIHDALPLAEAVDWTAPAADPEPALELPVIPRATLDAGPAVDKGGGLVGLPATAHGLVAGGKITMAGTVNYEGAFTLDGTTTADELAVAAIFNAETFTGAETATALVVTVT